MQHNFWDEKLDWTHRGLKGKNGESFQEVGRKKTKSNNMPTSWWQKFQKYKSDSVCDFCIVFWWVIEGAIVLSWNNTIFVRVCCDCLLLFITKHTYIFV